jgi:hypothetical protein
MPAGVPSRYKTGAHLEPTAAMDSAVGAGALYFLCYYIPGLLVGMAELEIEGDGSGFWASDLSTWRIVVFGPRMTLTGYHLTFFSALLSIFIVGVLVPSIWAPVEHIAGRVSLAIATFVMVSVVEDNTWWIYRGSGPPTTFRKSREFSLTERGVRYTIGTAVALGFYCAGGADFGLEGAFVFESFFISVGFYAAAVILDIFVWSGLRNCTRQRLMAETSDISLSSPLI